jgi:formaldehyde-activating enzyme involved in methanogenesis
LTTSASKAVSNILSSTLREYQGNSIFPVNGTNGKVFFNLTFSDEKILVFGKDQFTLPIDGTFLDQNKQGHSGDLPLLPTQLPNAKA